MPIRPILLKGHSRPLTSVKFNRDGDLLFSCAKDHKPCVWYSDNGERLGTYNGHTGAVFDCDPSWDSDFLLTGSSDCTVKLWQVNGGREVFSWSHRAGIRSVGFAHGERMFLAVQDNTFSQQPSIFIYNLSEKLKESAVSTIGDESDGAVVSSDAKDSQSTSPVRSLLLSGSNDKITEALWGELNATIISASDDGCVRIWDVESGKEVMRVSDHKKPINSMTFSKDRTMIITASSDHTAKLYDAKTLQLLKTFNSDRPLNAAAISPVMNHVIVGGGQEAMNVTVTSSKVGHFETDFFHLVYGDKLGAVKGHFGPINTLAFNPTGKSFASGAEDGYIRLHHLDKEYFNSKSNY